MEALFDEYNSYIDSLCDNILKAVDEILNQHLDTNGRVYFCAISRKMPKLLDILHGRLNEVWDRLYIFTEIAIPFIEWSEVKAVILADDAIYFGSTFKSVYQTIRDYAPDVKIVPISTIKASEVTLPFEKDLKTTYVPRVVGHYFVNCLSLSFRKKCTPFEVEFPVFQLKIPKGKLSKVVNVLKKKNEEFGSGKVYVIDNEISSYKNTKYKYGIAELGVIFSPEDEECKKVRLYCKDDALYFSSICPNMITRRMLAGNEMFSGTIFDTLWNNITKEIHDKDTECAQKSLCIAANFIYSLDYFFNVWNFFSNELSSIGIDTDSITLRDRECFLLFGKNISNMFMEWIIEKKKENYIFTHYEYINNLEFKGLVNSNEEFLPNLQYRDFYSSVQNRLLSRFTNVQQLLISLFYVQGEMLDKMNRSFTQLDSDRLKYGHTFGSIFYLLSKRNKNVEEMPEIVHSWIDAQIDAARLVPQYICVNTQKVENVWVRVFRSGENEMYVISHWARLCLAILKQELAILGTLMIDRVYFEALVTWIYRKYVLNKYSFFNAETRYNRNSYYTCIHIGKDEVNIIDMLVKMEILSEPKTGYISINSLLENDEILAGTVLPLKVMNEIKSYLEKLHDNNHRIYEVEYYTAFFDAKMFIGMDTEAVYDIIGALFKFIKENNESKDNLGLFKKINILKDIKRKQIANVTHSEKWYLEAVKMQTDKNLDGFILNLLKDENNRDASVLHQIINIIFYPSKGNKDRLLLFLKTLNNPKWNFLISVVTGTENEALLKNNVVNEILKKGRTIWTN